MMPLPSNGGGGTDAMAWRVGLQSIVIAIAVFGLIGAGLADSTLDKDQFTRDRPQVSPTQPEQRSVLPPPPPVDCPPGQHMEDGFCVVDTPAVTTKYGAIAVGTKNNTWYGVAWDRDTEEAAKTAAMDGCLNQARKKGSTNCRVVHSFSDSCVAMAWLNSGTGWGTAVRNTKEDAEGAALTQCRNYNPRRRCVLAGSWCTGN